jgi:hypothetical protein
MAIAPVNLRLSAPFHKFGYVFCESKSLITAVSDTN